MKIIRRSFGTQYALLELENGDYYHLPLESKYIPSVNDEFSFYDFDVLHIGTYMIEHDCDVEAYYHKTEPHHLKEL